MGISILFILLWHNYFFNILHSKSTPKICFNLSKDLLLWLIFLAKQGQF